MTLATKNGSIIVKDGALAENCGCCGGWYCCADTSCLTDWGSVAVTLSGTNRTKQYQNQGNCPGTSVHGQWYSFTAGVTGSSVSGETLSRSAFGGSGESKYAAYGSPTGAIYVQVQGRQITVTALVPAFYVTRFGRVDYNATVSWAGSFPLCGNNVSASDLGSYAARTRAVALIEPGVGCDEKGGLEQQIVDSDVGSGTVTLVSLSFA